MQAIKKTAPKRVRGGDLDDPRDLHLGRRLRRRRKLRGLSQEELGLLIGVRFQQIQKYESAINRMSATRLWDLADALDVPVSYFFEGYQAPPVSLAA